MFRNTTPAVKFPGSHRPRPVRGEWPTKPLNVGKKYKKGNTGSVRRGAANGSKELNRPAAEGVASVAGHCAVAELVRFWIKKRILKHRRLDVRFSLQHRTLAGERPRSALCRFCCRSRRCRLAGCGAPFGPNALGQHTRYAMH